MRSLDTLPVNQQLLANRPVEAYATRAPRKRTFLNGKLVYGDGNFTMDCLVRDISESGAKVVLTRHHPLPAELYLIVTKYCVAFHAKIRWVNFPARGLQFSRVYPLGGSLPKDLSFLQHLWRDLNARTGPVPETGRWMPEV
jgi:hypothetical protein